jgi:hypothetical protein
MRNNRARFQPSGNEPEIACGSTEFGRPLSRFPLRGKAGAGGFPPRRQHVARPAKGAGTHRAPAPPTRGLPPPCVSPAQRAGAGLMQCRHSAGLKRRIDFGRVVYTEYLTLPRNVASDGRQIRKRLHRILDTTPQASSPCRNDEFRRRAPRSSALPPRLNQRRTLLSTH